MSLLWRVLYLMTLINKLQYYFITHRSGERTFTEEDAEDILKTCFPDYTPNLVRDHPDVVQVTQIDKNRHWILLRDEIVGTECHGEAHIIGKDGALIVHSPFWQASKVTFKRKRGPEVSCEILKAE